MPPWEKYQQSSGPWNKYAQTSVDIENDLFPPRNSYSTEEKPEEGFIERVGDRFSGRIGATKEMLERRAPSGEQGPINAAGSILFNMPGTAAMAAGQVAGGINDVIGETIRSAYKGVVPESIQRKISETGENILNTKVGQMGLAAIQKGSEYYDDFKTKYPDAAMALEGAINVAALQTGGKTTAKAGRETLDVASDVSTLAQKVLPDNIEKNIFQNVQKNIVKGIRPGVEGKRTFGQAKSYFGKAKDAVKTIVQNKNNIKLTDEFGDTVQGVLPKSLTQFSEAINETKKAVFRQYDDLARSSGTSINLSPVVRELQSVSSNSVINDFSPSIAKYADDLAESLIKRGTYSATQAQDAISRINSSLEAFYKNPTYETATKASIDSMVANIMRKELDNAITSATGAEYQALKSQYGALKAIERDVNRRMIVDLRKNTKGLLDFSDIFSGAEAVSAIVKKSPSAFATAATAKGIAKFYKKMNDPNRYIEKMFLTTEKLMEREKVLSGSFVPKSQTVKILTGN